MINNQRLVNQLLNKIREAERVTLEDLISDRIE